MEYIEQSLRQVRLKIFKNDFDENQLTKIIAKGYLKNGLSITLHIIGESHFLRIKLPNGQIINEVLACIDLAIPAQAEQFCFGPISSVSTKSEITIDNFNIKLDLKTRVLNKAEYQEIEKCCRAVDELNDKNNFMTLKLNFPGKTDDEPPAQTIVIGCFNQEDNIFQLETVHSYPNEKRAIFSKSEYKF